MLTYPNVFGNFGDAVSRPVVRAKSGKERARERQANIAKNPLILAQFYPGSQMFKSKRLCFAKAAP